MASAAKNLNPRRGELKPSSKRPALSEERAPRTRGTGPALAPWAVASGACWALSFRLGVYFLSSSRMETPVFPATFALKGLLEKILMMMCIMD